jgi:hypothetical protein
MNACPLSLLTLCRTEPAQRAFYLMKPQGDTLKYVVDQQFKTARCQFQLFVPRGYSDAEVMKIVATLGPTH